MQQGFFPEGKNVESNFMQGSMNEMIPAVKNKSGLNHLFINPLLIQFKIFLPLGYKSHRVSSVKCFINVLEEIHITF